MAAAGLVDANKRAFYVKITPYIGRVISLTGGEVKMARGKMYNGGATVPDLVNGRREIGDLTSTVLYRPRTYGPMTKTLLQVFRSQVFTITKQDMDEYDHTINRPMVYSGCKLSQLTLPDYDEQSDTDGSLLSMMFTVAGLT